MSKEWQRLDKDDADYIFWCNIDFPMFGKYGGKQYSFWKINIKHSGRGNYYSWDMFIERSDFKIWYNPFEDKFRIYLNPTLRSGTEVYDSDELYIKKDLLDRIEDFIINKKSYKDRLKEWR